MPVEGGAEEEIQPRITQFGVTAKGIYFAVPEEKAMRFRDASGVKERVFPTSDPPYAPSQITVSPHDVYVVWVQLDRDTRDLMLVEGFR